MEIECVRLNGTAIVNNRLCVTTVLRLTSLTCPAQRQNNSRSAQLVSFIDDVPHSAVVIRATESNDFLSCVKTVPNKPWRVERRAKDADFFFSLRVQLDSSACNISDRGRETLPQSSAGTSPSVAKTLKLPASRNS